MKSRSKGIIVQAMLFLAILIVVANTLLAFHSIQVLVDGEAWVTHTWQVIGQIDEVMAAVGKAGTGNLRFLLSGDEKDLQSFRTSQAELPGELDTLQTLTADNPVQQRATGELRAAIRERLERLQTDIDSRRRADLGVERALALNESGGAQMDYLRSIGKRMEAEERRLLDIRTVTSRHANRNARYAVAFSSIIDFMLIIFIFRYLIRERVLRLVTEEVAANLAVSRATVEANAVELQALNRTLEERVRQRTAELETTNRELEAFSYSVSHDLRAPLRTIDGFSLALEEDYAEAVGATGKDYIKRVRSGVQRMGELIDALLQLSRITRASIQREHFDLSALAKAVATDLREQNPGRGIDFKIQDGLECDADAALLRVALENLFGNAVKFSAKVQRSLIEFGWDGEQNAWFIRDNGAGFDMYYAEKLFNAFNRLHGDKDFKGSGIGLATVARVIRRHHGTIWADSVVGHGATFRFTLG